jgi:hypothetical protein
LLAFARLGVKDQPMARLTLPLSGGGLIPADASGFTGLAFDVRGEGAYRILLGVRGRSPATPLGAGFDAGPEWRRVAVPFARFDAAGLPPSWTMGVLTVAFELPGPPGSQRWLEIANVAFMR